MTVPISPRRLSLTLVLFAALAGCAGPKPQQPAAAPNPASGSTGQGPASRTQDPGSTNRTNVEQSLAAATDLFNRGENDLACDQVRRAASLAPAPLAAEQQAQLERYRKACEPL